MGIINRATEQLVLLDPYSGDSEWLGGRGEGPKEFGQLGSIFYDDETRVGAFDSERMRFVIFQEGEIFFDRSVPLSPFGHKELLKVGLDLLYVVYTGGDSVPVDRGGNAYRPTGGVHRIDRGTNDSLTAVPGRAIFASAGRSWTLPFGAYPVAAAADTGVWVADTAHPQVEYWTRGRRPLWIVRWTASGDRSLSRERIEKFIDLAVLRMDPPPESLRGIREIFEAAPYPSQIPAFGQLVRGPGGSAWIGEYVDPEVTLLGSPRPEQRWIVFDEIGTPLGVAVTPPGLRVTQFGADYVIGVYTDSRGVETVRRYKLNRVEDLQRAPVAPWEMPEELLF